MLLGALVDMGASAVYTEQELSCMGMDADIICDRVKRSGMEAVFAYAKCRSCETESNMKYKSKLENMCEALGEDYASSENICQWAAVLSCIDCFGADKIICSPITDGSGIDCVTGKPVPEAATIELIKKYRIPIRNIDVQKELISAEGTVFLGENADEFGMLPVGNILCIGYGAGEENVDGCVNIVRCVLTETEEMGILEKELEMLLK